MDRTSTTTRTIAKSPWLELPAWVRWGGILLFNTAVALFLTGIDFGGPFAVNWLFSQSIGLTIYLGVESALRWLPRGRQQQAGLVVAVTGGSLLGAGLGYLLTGLPLLNGFGERFWQTVVVSLLFGAAVTVFAFHRERTLLVEKGLREMRLKHLQADKARIEAELRLLQAQVEPHFLFNTLALLRGLIRRDPDLGQRLLDHLIDYLRASLCHSRKEHITLGEELDLLANYLAIMRLRMGERLRFHIDVPDALRQQRLSPMLLQPLVENAIRHGLEPKPGPVALSIRARAVGDYIDIDVIDDGVGLGGNQRAGTGLANVRERLLALYGHQSRLQVQENPDGGVTARLRLPRS
ncbi:MAG: histidine kinase [Xanthomonadaceae bacterium]|nr:histidine kinase [Xanthomonadaceae bacterium]